MKSLVNIFIFLFLVSSVFAVGSPPVTDPLRFTGSPSMSSVPPPPSGGGTGSNTSCNEGVVRNEKCDGNIRVFEQCILMLNGNIWNYRSEECSEHGASCQNGVCVAGSSTTPNSCGNTVCEVNENTASCPTDCKSTTTQKNNMWIWIGVAAIALFIIMRWKK